MTAPRNFDLCEEIRPYWLRDSGIFDCVPALSTATDGAFGPVGCRHLIWTLTERKATLTAWRRALRPGGQLTAFYEDRMCRYARIQKRVWPATAYIGLLYQNADQIRDSSGRREGSFWHVSQQRCLNQHLLFPINQARAVIGGWAYDYETARPH